MSVFRNGCGSLDAARNNCRAALDDTIRITRGSWRTLDVAGIPPAALVQRMLRRSDGVEAAPPPSYP
jgi:hypothetical protein